MIEYVLCDVEGTTTDIRFVHDKLFPFALANLERFYQRNHTELRRSAKQLGVSADQVVFQLKKFIEQDIKDQELKRIQGLIWQQGYASGELLGHVYPDVLPAFKRWKERGIRIGIYSSGSVWAQKLLFGHSVEGDLCRYLADHFDLAVGYKYEATSYQLICKRLFHQPREILFLSDVEIELDCAREAGMQTIRLFRDMIEETSHASEMSFEGIL